MNESTKGFLITLIFLVSIQLSAQHFQTVWSGNAFQPMSIIVTQANIDGDICVTGDEIAVFDTNDLEEEICVGTSVLTNVITPSSPLVIIASKDDNLTPEFDGFIDGHSIIFKMWDSSNSLEITTISAAFDTTSPFVVVYTSLNTALVELDGFSAINTTVASDSGCPGDFIIPITVSNMIAVAEFNLKLDFNSEKLTYVNYQNIHDSLSLGTLTVTPLANSVEINWISANTISLTNDTLLELIFQGDTVTTQFNSLLEWDTIGSSYYLNSSLDTLDCLFNNGLITIDPEPGNPGIIIGNDNLCQGSLNEAYEVDTVANTTNYVWELIPSVSGTIVGSGPLIHIDWSSSWSGTASLELYSSNSCGNSSSSWLYVNIESNPFADAGSDTAICYNNSYQLAATATEYSSILWTTFGDGIFNDSSLLNATYFPGTSDIENGEVILTITANAIAPCTNIAIDSLLLLIDDSIGFPGIPVGPVNVNSAITPITNYAILPVENASWYCWSIYPPGVGEILGEAYTSMVIWNTAFPDTTAKIVVEAGNACGSEVSDTLLVEVYFTVGLLEKVPTQPNICISPNPTTGFLVAELVCSGNAELQIVNMQGVTIMQKRFECADNEATILGLDLRSFKKGFYFLRFINKNTVQKKAFIVN